MVHTRTHAPAHTHTHIHPHTHTHTPAHTHRKDSSLAFMWFFFAMAFQVLSFILGAIGPPTLGAWSVKYFDSESSGCS